MFFLLKKNPIQDMAALVPLFPSQWYATAGNCMLTEYLRLEGTSRGRLVQPPGSSWVTYNLLPRTISK